MGKAQSSNLCANLALILAYVSQPRGSLDYVYFSFASRMCIPKDLGRVGHDYT